MSAATNSALDAHDKAILDVIQSGFPLEPRPWEAVGRQVGLSGDEVLARVKALKASGVIRRIGGNFNSNRLGWRSTLCAASVPEDKIEAFVAEVNRHDGVTHNYLRENDFNIWFTFIGEDEESSLRVLDEIMENTGIKVLDLPADRLFKIKVDFAMNPNRDED